MIGTVAVTAATHTAPAVFCSGVGSVSDFGRPMMRRAAASMRATPSTRAALTASQPCNAAPVRRVETSEAQSPASTRMARKSSGNSPMALYQSRGESRLAERAKSACWKMARRRLTMLALS